VVVTTIHVSAAEIHDAQELKRARESQAHNLLLLHEAGVQLAIGPDVHRATALAEALDLHALGLLDELTLLKMWCESTPHTIFPQRKIGRLAEGYEASFLVLDGNPLEDFEHVKQIRLPFKQGRPLSLPSSHGPTGRSDRPAGRQDPVLLILGQRACGSLQRGLRTQEDAMQRLRVLFAVSLLGSVAAAQSPQLLPLPQTGATGSMNPPVVGDFDGDGVLDLALSGIGSNPMTQGVTVRRGRGAGFLHAAEVTPLAVFPKAIAAGDIDGDGKDDVLSSTPFSGTVQVLSDFSAPSFQSVATLSYPPAGPVDGLVAGGDFDGDGNLDVAALAMAGNAPFHVYLGDGTGGFTGPFTSSAGAGSANSLCVGDFNEDGRSDIAFEKRNTFVYVAFGQPGGLGAPVSFDTGHILNQVRRGDADQDGHDDVLCSIYDWPPGYGLIVARGDGSGALLPGSLISTSLTSWSAVDLNGDGLNDLVADNGGYFLGLGGGNFGPAQGIDAPLHYAGEPRFDLNQDGLPDYVSRYFDTLTLIYSEGPLQYPNTLGTNSSGDSATIAAGDFDENGKLDLVVGDSSLNRIVLLSGNGAGSFTPASTVSAMQKPLTMASADFDADGHLDFVAGSWPNSTLSVFRGNGAGGFAPPTTVTLQGPPNEVLAEDLNGDGKIDLAAACGSGVEAAIALGLGGGAFAPMQGFDLVEGNGSYGLCSLDANGDAWRDLAFTLNPSNKVRILLGSASGTFTLGPTFSCGASPLRIASGDLDRDGNDDLIVAGQHAGIFLGNGAGGFAQSEELSAIGMPPWLDAAVADLDGDGFEDAVGLGANGAALFARGNGRAQFEPLTWFAGGSSLSENSGFALADFTSDGLVDFARPTGDSIPFVLLLQHLPNEELPLVYCEPKASSNGCVPQISFEGMPSASATSGFMIRARPALNQKPGLIIYSLFGPASQTLGGGTLCVSSPLRRSAATNSGGTALPAVDCSGGFSLDFAAFAHGLLGGTPAPELLVPGTSVAGQWFGRDPGFAPPNNLMLSNGLLWTVFP